MSNPTLDKEALIRRLKRIYQTWNEPTNETEALSKVNTIIVPVGTDEDEVTYSKSKSLHYWLFGYELSDTIIAFSKEKIIILSSKRKIEFLKPIEHQKENQEIPIINLLVRDKNDKDKINFEKLIQFIKKDENENYGEFSKDKYSNEFISDFKTQLNNLKYHSVDVSASFAFIMSVKEESEIDTIKKASNVTVEVFNKFVKEQLSNIVDQEKKVKHLKFSESIEKAFEDRKYLKNLDRNQVDLCYSPIIQSGGNYNLKFSAMTDKNNIHFGAIICSFGAKYKQYCSNIVRTILVDPTEDQQKIYEYLVSLEELILEKLVDGSKFCNVYNHIISKVQKEHKKLVENLTKSFGFIMGLEFKEGSLHITPKNTTIIKKGMVFNIAIGFSNLKKESETYSLFIGDTVLVHQDKPAEILTNSKKRIKNISIFLKDDDEKSEGSVEAVQEENILAKGRRNNAILESKLRTEPSTEEKRKIRQKELAEKLNKEALERLTKKSNTTKEEKTRKAAISYKSFNQMPKEDQIKELKIFVDKTYETVVLPIFGIPTPFHISTIKNISQSVEGDYTYLRINFFHPGSTLGKGETNFGTPEATFLKEITYRSTNVKEPGEISAPSSNLNAAFRLIKEVQKKFKTREAEEKEMEGIVKQDNLILSNNKGNPKLKDLYIRPNIYSKRINGTLEAHTNGFRFTSIRGDKVDLLYNNLKHAFYQPCDSEAIILIHFTLKNAIVFGKKKHIDVQFYTEVGEITTDLGKHQHMHDRDDLAQEQAERELRQKLKSAFKSFCDKVEQLTKQFIEFEVPFRELSFTGVPYRSIVLLQPTSACLVNLTEQPPFVITLDEIELVHFERVSFTLKNFDMVFIFKDYSRKVVSVSAIPMQQLDSVKEWLTSCDIRYTQGPQSLNWTKIMKTITDDPEDFFSNGGWSFLDSDSTDEEGEAGSDEEIEEDADFEPEESDVNESASESDYSEEESDDYSEEDEEEEEENSSEESGKSWSELEEEARAEDRQKDLEQGLRQGVTTIKEKSKNKRSYDESPKSRKKSKKK